MIPSDGLAPGVWAWLLDVTLSRLAVVRLTKKDGGAQWDGADIWYYEPNEPGLSDWVCHWPAEYLELATLEEIATAQLASAQAGAL